jgi:hypothetical protein
MLRRSDANISSEIHVVFSEKMRVVTREQDLRKGRANMKERWKELMEDEVLDQSAVTIGKGP